MRHARILVCLLLLCAACGDDGTGPGGQPPLPTDGWQWEHPLPQGNALLATWARDDGSAWAVGNTGTVLELDGTDTKIHDTPTRTGLRDIWSPGGRELFAVGGAPSGRVLLHYDGRHWNEESLPAPPELFTPKRCSPIYLSLESVAGRADGTLFVSDSLGWLFHYDGERWDVSRSSSPWGFRDIWAAPDTEDAYAANGTVELHHFDGQEWTPLSFVELDPNLQLRAITGTTHDEVYAAGSALLHFDGESWERYELPEQGLVEDLCLTEDGELLLLYLDGSLYRGTVGNWKEEILPATVQNSVPTGVSHEGGRSWISYRDAQILQEDAGAWTERSLRVMSDRSFINAFWGLDASRVVAISGTSSELLCFDGMQWAHAQAGERRLLAVGGEVGGVAAVVDDSGAFYAVEGCTPHLLHEGPGVELFDAAVRSPDEAYALAGDGSLMQSLGEEWTTIASVESSNWMHMAAGEGGQLHIAISHDPGRGGPTIRVFLWDGDQLIDEGTAGWTSGAQLSGLFAHDGLLFVLGQRARDSCTIEGVCSIGRSTQWSVHESLPVIHSLTLSAEGEILGFGQGGIAGLETGRLARYDGNAWTVESLAITDQVLRSGWSAPDGELFVGGGGGMVVRRMP